MDKDEYANFDPKVAEVLRKADAHEREMRKDHPELFRAPAAEALSSEPLPLEEQGRDKMDLTPE